MEKADRLAGYLSILEIRFLRDRDTSSSPIWRTPRTPKVLMTMIGTMAMARNKISIFQR